MCIKERIYQFLSISLKRSFKSKIEWTSTYQHSMSMYKVSASDLS